MTLDAGAATSLPLPPSLPTSPRPARTSPQHSAQTSTPHAQQLRCRFATAQSHASQNRRHPDPGPPEGTHASSASSLVVDVVSASARTSSSSVNRRVANARAERERTYSRRRSTREGARSDEGVTPGRGGAEAEASGPEASRKEAACFASEAAAAVLPGPSGFLTKGASRGAEASEDSTTPPLLPLLAAATLLARSFALAACAPARSAALSAFSRAFFAAPVRAPPFSGGFSEDAAAFSVVLAPGLVFGLLAPRLEESGSSSGEPFAGSADDSFRRAPSFGAVVFIPAAAATAASRRLRLDAPARVLFSSSPPSPAPAARSPPSPGEPSPYARAALRRASAASRPKSAVTSECASPSAALTLASLGSFAPSKYARRTTEKSKGGSFFAESFFASSESEGPAAAPVPRVAGAYARAFAANDEAARASGGTGVAASEGVEATRPTG